MYVRPRVLVLVFVCCAAIAASNPAAGVPWHWLPRLPTVISNVKVLPYKQVVEAHAPKARAPGTKAVDGCGAGGTAGSPHAYPWMVGIYIDSVYFCEGSIISEEWVLAAAHCMDGAITAVVVAGAENITVDEPSQVFETSSDILVHEDYSAALLRNDIALIHLPSPLTWTTEILPVCLPAYSDSDLVEGDIVTLTGWGSSSDGLYEVTVPVVETSVCAASFGASLSADVLCTASQGATGTCAGHSGGPVNYIDGANTVIRGIQSFGSSAECQTGDLDAHTRVSHYLSWIETNTGIVIDP